MAETDILNPIPGTPGDWASVGLQFNPNPSYGFERRVSQNRATARPAMGPFVTRDVGNGGHIFPLSWIGTDLSTAQRVLKFFHDFKWGYFTFINVDWNQRHFVGRFTEEPQIAHVANNKYTIQNATFEEIPTARMLVYPTDWTNDGHTINAVDDVYLKPMAAFLVGTWITQVSPVAPSGASIPASMEAIDVTPAAGDCAQMQYIGWGFQMTFRLATGLGKINILLDGTVVVTDLNLVTGAAAATAGSATVSAPSGGFVTVSVPSVSLDMHLVTVITGATWSAGSILFPQLTYIY